MPLDRPNTEERYQTLFNYAPDGIVIADSAGVYIDANPSLCRLFGYDREEFIGKSAIDVVEPSEQAYIQPALDTINARRLHNRLWRFRRKDGSVFPAEVIATSMPDGNIMVMIRDITEQDLLERQFLRAQRMESVGRLASGIAHDLNNVLLPILMSSELLLEKVTAADARELVGTIHSSAQRGADLIRQVLSFSRGIEGERIALDPAPLIDDLIAVTRETFPRSIAVRLETAAGCPLTEANPTQLNQVFMNLLVNARDAMPDGGRLTITIDAVTVGEEDRAMAFDATPGRFVRIGVADTGSGVPPELREKIFEPFFTTKDFGRGSGLGLSTSIGIVKSHSGFITLESEPGRGSHFAVYLPALADDRLPDVAPRERLPPPKGNRERILVVDDEPAIRQAAQRTLEHHGYRVVVATNGAQAETEFRSAGGDIALVLTDMMMPVMDGGTLISRLRQVDPHVKIIASSGLPDTDGRADQFLQKPYTADTMLRAVASVLVKM